MFGQGHIPNKRPGEKILLVARRHWLFVFAHIAFYALLGVIPIVLYYLLDFTIPTLLQNSFGIASLLLVGSVYYLFIFLFLFTSYIDYHLDIWIVTNQRIIYVEQLGLFSRKISDHSLDKVQDVTAEQKGFLATFFTFGDVMVQTAGEHQQFVFKQIDNPFDVKQRISELVRSVGPSSNANATK